MSLRNRLKKSILVIALLSSAIVAGCSKTSLEVSQNPALDAEDIIERFKVALSERDKKKLITALDLVESNKNEDALSANFDWSKLWRGIEVIFNGQNVSEILGFIREDIEEEFLTRILDLHLINCRQDYYSAFQNTFIAIATGLSKIDDPLVRKGMIQRYLENRESIQVKDRSVGSTGVTLIKSCSTLSLSVESIHLVLSELFPDEPYSFYENSIASDDYKKLSENQKYAQAVRILDFVANELDTVAVDTAQREYFFDPLDTTLEIESYAKYLMPKNSSVNLIRSKCKSDNISLCLWYGLISRIAQELNSVSSSQLESKRWKAVLSSLDKLINAILEKAYVNNQVLSDSLVQFTGNQQVQNYLLAAADQLEKGYSDILRNWQNIARSNFSSSKDRLISESELYDLFRTIGVKILRRPILANEDFVVSADEFMNVYQLARIMLLSGDAVNDSETKKSGRLNDLFLDLLDRHQRKLEAYLLSKQEITGDEFDSLISESALLTEKVMIGFIYLRVYLELRSQNSSMADRAASRARQVYSQIPKELKDEYSLLDLLQIYRFKIYFTYAFTEKESNGIRLIGQNANQSKVEDEIETLVEAYCEKYDSIRVSNNGGTLKYDDDFEQFESFIGNTDFGAQIKIDLLQPSLMRPLRGCVVLTDPKAAMKQNELSRTDYSYLGYMTERPESNGDSRTLKDKKIVLKNEQNDIELPLDSFIVAPGFSFEIHSRTWESGVLHLGGRKSLERQPAVPDRMSQDAASVPILLVFEYLPEEPENSTSLRQEILPENGRNQTKVIKPFSTQVKLNQYLASEEIKGFRPGYHFSPFHLVLSGPGTGKDPTSDNYDSNFNGGDLKLVALQGVKKFKGVYVSSGSSQRWVSAQKGGKGLEYDGIHLASRQWIDQNLKQPYQFKNEVFTILEKPVAPLKVSSKENDKLVQLVQKMRLTESRIQTLEAEVKVISESRIQIESQMASFIRGNGTEIALLDKLEKIQVNINDTLTQYEKLVFEVNQLRKRSNQSEADLKAIKAKEAKIQTAFQEIEKLDTELQNRFASLDAKTAFNQNQILLQLVIVAVSQDPSQLGVLQDYLSSAQQEYLDKLATDSDFLSQVALATARSQEEVSKYIVKLSQAWSNENKIEKPKAEPNLLPGFDARLILQSVSTLRAKIHSLKEIMNQAGAPASGIALENISMSEFKQVVDETLAEKKKLKAGIKDIQNRVLEALKTIKAKESFVDQELKSLRALMVELTKKREFLGLGEPAQLPSYIPSDFTKDGFGKFLKQMSYRTLMGKNNKGEPIRLGESGVFFFVPEFTRQYLINERLNSEADTQRKEVKDHFQSYFAEKYETQDFDELLEDKQKFRQWLLRWMKQLKGNPLIFLSSGDVDLKVQAQSTSGASETMSAWNYFRMFGRDRFYVEEGKDGKPSQKGSKISERGIVELEQ